MGEEALEDKGGKKKKKVSSSEQGTRIAEKIAAEDQAKIKASEEKQESSNRKKRIKKVKKCIEKLFGQYDLDDSGLIDSVEELRQLSLNVTMKVRLGVSISDLEEQLEDVDVE